jgi:hypothetical protein
MGGFKARPFFLKMNILQINTADQVLRLTLAEGRQYFEDHFTDYLLVITREEKSPAGLSIAQVPVVILENERYTELEITTVGLTTTGQYRYVVYGQNSNSNTDPEDAVVVGEVEQGWLTLIGDSEIFVTPQITISNDKIYGQ